MKNAKFEKLRIFAVLPEAMTSMIDQLPVCHSDLCLQLCAVFFLTTGRFASLWISLCSFCHVFWQV